MLFRMMSSDIRCFVHIGAGCDSQMRIFLSPVLWANSLRRCFTTTFGDIVSAVTAFASSYDIYVIAGLVLGAGAWLVRKLVKAGR